MTLARVAHMDPKKNETKEEEKKDRPFPRQQNNPTVHLQGAEAHLVRLIAGADAGGIVPL